MTEIDGELGKATHVRRRPRRLVVIAENARELARLELDRSPWAKSGVVPMIGLSAADLHAQLAALRAVDLVVDARTSSGPAQLQAFEDDFWHVDPQGAWVALRSAPPIRWRERMVRLAHEIEASRSRRGVRKQWREHARSMSQVRVSRGMVVMAKRKKQHRLGVREAEAPALLRTREPA
jgi:hypothetical protein